MIKIQKTGVVVDVSPQARADLARQFSENHYLRFPNLLSEDLLQDFTEQFRTESWVERIHKGIGVEVCLNDPTLIGLMNFLLNDQSLFALIQELTGCGHIGCFEGRFYRMLPQAGHYDSWHTDYSGHRLVALSVNLSQEAYAGGTLQLRHHNEKDWFAELPNTGYGDAILFRIAPHLEHRVTPVVNAAPKTAFAGWFKDQPDFWSSLIAGSRDARPTDNEIVNILIPAASKHIMAAQGGSGNVVTEKGEFDSGRNYRINPDVVANRVGDQIVIVHIKTDRIFSLSPTASRFWELFSSGMGRQEIETALLGEFQVGSDQLTVEIENILSSLKNEGIIVDE